MRSVCLVGKYPPIEGGGSRNNYLLARLLASSDIRVHIVTNATRCQSEYRTQGVHEHSLGANSHNVKVHNTTGLPTRAYVPWAMPFVTELTSLGIEVVEEYNCETVIGYYFEPYGIAARAISSATRRPYGLGHAGSDVGFLLNQPSVRTAYVRLIRDADFIFASCDAAARFLALGARIERLYPPPLAAIPRVLFTPNGPQMDARTVLNLVSNDSRTAELNRRCSPEPISARFDPALPILGMYGKFDETKGTFDVIDALAMLASRGRKFTFMILGGAGGGRTDHLVRAINLAGIGHSTLLLPFVPYEMVPTFIRTCLAVFCLEREFPIKAHSPALPQEVMSCGRALVISPELLGKQPQQKRMLNGHNVLIADSRDLTNLISTIDTILCNPSAAVMIGKRGTELLPLLEDVAAEERKSIDLFNYVVSTARTSRTQKQIDQTKERPSPELEGWIASFRAVSEVATWANY